MIPLSNTAVKAKAPVKQAAEGTMTGVTPTDLAEELDISPKSLRAWLRTNYTRPLDAKNSRWYLTDKQVKAAKDHYIKPKKAE